MEVFEAINNRRSIRQQKSDPVDEKTVEKILEAARWAPSWANTQGWRFIVVRDTKLKEQAAATMFRRPGSTEMSPTAQAIMDAPVLIVLCAEMGKSGIRPDGSSATDKGDWYMFDVALATQNLVLAAHALGLGTVIIGAFDAPKVDEILAVPSGYSEVTKTPVGVPAQEGRTPVRKELAELVSNDKFGS